MTREKECLEWIRDVKGIDLHDRFSVLHSVLEWADEHPSVETMLELFWFFDKHGLINDDLCFDPQHFMETVAKEHFPNFTQGHVNEEYNDPQEKITDTIQIDRMKKWNDICNDYLKEFCNRHDYAYHPEDWIGGEVGGIIEISDMFVSMDNIRYDVDNDIDPNLFAKWYWKNLDIYELTGQSYMNYPSFCKGAPDPWTDERIMKIRSSKQRIREAEKELETEINSIRHEHISY